MAIGALPSLATGDYPRTRTQQWARAIFEDQPVDGTTVRGVYYDAAHTNGPALALWNTDDDIETLIDHGQDQDFALTDPRVWTRVSRDADAIRLRLQQVARCALCP